MSRLLTSLTASISTASVLLTAAVAAYAQTPDLVRPAKAAERTAAIGSIQAQLKAFGRDDYKTAITYQSSSLKKNFASPLQFRAMIVQAYPEFAHSKRVVFGPAQTDATGAHLAILTAVTGQDGVTVRAVYLMVREGKVYRVDGVAGGGVPPPGDDAGMSGRDV